MPKMGVVFDTDYIGLGLLGLSLFGGKVGLDKNIRKRLAQAAFVVYTATTAHEVYQKAKHARRVVR